MKEHEKSRNKEAANGKSGSSLINKDSPIGQARNLLKSSIVDASLKYKKRSTPDKNHRPLGRSILSLVVSGIFLCLFLGITSALVFFCLF